MERISRPEHKVDRIPSANRAWREQQAAEYLGVSVKTLQAWRFYSKGPKYLKISRSIRYLQEDLDEFIESSKINPAA